MKYCETSLNHLGQSTNHLQASFRTVCQANNIEFHQVTHSPTFRAVFKGRNDIFVSFVAPTVDISELLVLTFYDSQVPKNKRYQVAELMERINSKLHYGTFICDMDGGSILLRTRNIFGAVRDDALVKHVMFCNWLAVDAFAPAINAVVCSGADPKKAFDTVIDSDSFYLLTYMEDDIDVLEEIHVDDLGHPSEFFKRLETSN